MYPSILIVDPKKVLYSVNYLISIKVEINPLTKQYPNSFSSILLAPSKLPGVVLNGGTRGGLMVDTWCGRTDETWKIGCGFLVDRLIELLSDSGVTKGPIVETGMTKSPSLTVAVSDSPLASSSSSFTRGIKENSSFGDRVLVLETWTTISSFLSSFVVSVGILLKMSTIFGFGVTSLSCRETENGWPDKPRDSTSSLPVPVDPDPEM